LAFLESGESLEQRLAGNQAEHSVAQELEQFVVARARRTAGRA
jgi:hypothetical protein